MSKPLTIEELKALKVGDWVWVVSRLSNIGIYEQIRCSDATSMFFDSGYCISYSEYETKWAIYKNKEQAEAKGEIVELLCKVGTPLFELKTYYKDKSMWCVEAGHCSMLQQKADGSWKIRFSYGYGSCHDVTLDRFAKDIFTDKSEAERRLAELKGE